jgi:predicted ATP-dependent endonuclease of OLD family
MQIKSLRVKNFRSIQELYLELPRICAFVGPNNSGKTNLLEAIRRVLAPEWGPRATHFSEEDVYLRDSDRDIEIECSFEPAITYKNLRIASQQRSKRFALATTDTSAATKLDIESWTKSA